MDLKFFFYNVKFAISFFFYLGKNNPKAGKGSRFTHTEKLQFAPVRFLIYIQKLLFFISKTIL